MRRLLERLRRPVRMTRQRGIALIAVTVTLAVLGAVAADFAYNARVDLEAAANARDQLRAEYLARSGIQLSRLLLKVQQKVLDPNKRFIGDIQIADYAPYLMKAFGGDAEERAGLLGGLLGIDTSNLKGLGVGKNATFDVEMVAEDGKLNINCGGGLGGMQQQPILYGVLASMFWPPRYNRIFEGVDADGQYATRDDVARAIIDWADSDTSRYEPMGPGGGAEDYRYDIGKDPYRAHDHYYDTIEELNLVRGVGDEFWGSFGEMLTVYGGCKVNLSAIQQEHWPLMAAILRATVKDDQRSNQMLADDVQMAGWAQSVLGLIKMPMMGTAMDIDQFAKLAQNPMSVIPGMTGAAPQSASQGQMGLPLDVNKLKNVAVAGNPRRFWRIDSTGTVTRGGKTIEVHIRAVWDQQHININSTSGDPNDRIGTWLYWRQD